MRACTLPPVTPHTKLTHALCRFALAFRPQVMGALMKKHRGEFDGKEANKWVADMLSP